MTVTYATFLHRFPQFIPHPSGIVNGGSHGATADASEDVFGDQTHRAVKHLAAHIIAIQLAQMGVQIGATEGKVYGKGLEATQYGQEFKRMLQTGWFSFLGFVV
uniref:Uncharacterized protein n=1 Tax=Bacteriophage sp. TaxID=38018 RepID=A0A7G8LRH2_9VIRU|nr:MAG: hypothetical protein [Bacteriophage sp.]